MDHFSKKKKTCEIYKKKGCFPANNYYSYSEQTHNFIAESVESEEEIHYSWAQLTRDRELEDWYSYIIVTKHEKGSKIKRIHLCNCHPDRPRTKLSKHCRVLKIAGYEDTKVDRIRDILG